VIDRTHTVNTVGDMKQTSQDLSRASDGHGVTTSSDSSASMPAISWGARAWRLNRPWLTEAVLVVSMYMLYSWTRSAAPDRVALAMGHAADVESFQRALGLSFELPLNQLFMRHLWLADFGSYFYQIAHMVVTFGLLIWLWLRRRGLYGHLRTALAFLWLAGLSTYWIYPLAPPRFHLDGAVDSMAAHPVLFAGKESVTGLANLYAAMPSLHVGWSTWVALSLVTVLRSRWRYLVWLYPCTMTFVVMGTANHYLMDAVVGATYATACWLLARWIYGRQDQRRAARAAVAAG